MGSMSASDAAPLPRLGEVFFDVRGSSRSMRLSWYSDTGVAVFSIWQGGTCTGTFRLPIEDLSRMVEALQRGPRGAGLPVANAADATSATGGRPGLPGEPGPVTPFPEYATGQHIAPVTGEFRRPDLGDRDMPAAAGGPGAPALVGSYPEPSFRDDSLGSGSYRQQPAPSYSPAAPSPSPSYREDPLTSPSYRDEARSAGYRDSGERPYGDDPLGSGGYRQQPAPSYSPSSYREDPLTGGSYPGDPLSPASYREEPRPGGYRDSGERPYGDDPLGSGSYPQPSYRPGGYPDRNYSPAGQDAGYSAAGQDSSYPPVYRDGDSGGYPAGEPGRYQGEDPGSYRGEPRGHRYADDPFQSIYPDEPRGGSHPYGPPDPEPRRRRGRPSRT